MTFNETTIKCRLAILFSIFGFGAKNGYLNNLFVFDFEYKLNIFSVLDGQSLCPSAETYILYNVQASKS